jgi:cytochrome bd-type quinol oxidase subunit 2
VWKVVDPPRRWLVLAVVALFASFVPYWEFFDEGGILINAALVLVATGALFKNVRGERRLQDAEKAQGRMTEGAPNGTSDSGTSTDPSSR